MGESAEAGGEEEVREGQGVVAGAARVDLGLELPPLAEEGSRSPGSRAHGAVTPAQGSRGATPLLPALPSPGRARSPGRVQTPGGSGRGEGAGGGAGEEEDEKEDQPFELRPRSAQHRQASRKKALAEAQLQGGIPEAIREARGVYAKKERAFEARIQDKRYRDRARALRNRVHPNARDEGRPTAADMPLSLVRRLKAGLQGSMVTLYPEPLGASVGIQAKTGAAVLIPAPTPNGGKDAGPKVILGPDLVAHPMLRPLYPTVYRNLVDLPQENGPTFSLEGLRAESSMSSLGIVSAQSSRTSLGAENSGVAKDEALASSSRERYLYRARANSLRDHSYASPRGSMDMPANEEVADMILVSGEAGKLFRKLGGELSTLQEQLDTVTARKNAIADQAESASASQAQKHQAQLHALERESRRVRAKIASLEAEMVRIYNGQVRPYKRKHSVAPLTHVPTAGAGAVLRAQAAVHMPGFNSTQQVVGGIAGLAPVTTVKPSERATYVGRADSPPDKLRFASHAKIFGADDGYRAGAK